MPNRATTPYPWQRIPHLIMRIRYKQAALAHNELDTLLDEFHIEHDRRLGPRKLRCAMLVSYCLRGARLGGGQSDAILNDVFTSIDKLDSCRSWRDVRKFMHTYLDLMLSHVQPRNQPRHIRLIARMQRELLDTPKKAESLQAYAKSARLNPDYLSRMFKRQTGQSFCDLRHHGRMVAAQHMLAVSNAKIQTIAQRVGMNDPSQFIKAFKKLTGQTPHQFRELCHRA